MGLPGITLIGADDGALLGGTVGDDIIVGGNFGTNVISAGIGDDTVIGGAQIDYVFDDAGDDWLSGGNGNNDTIAFTVFGTAPGRGGQEYLDPVVFDLTKHKQDMGALGVDTFYGFENVTGGSGNDKLYGAGGANSLVGGKGNDLVDGRAGNDHLVGNAGHDTLIGGAGTDIMSGKDEGKSTADNESDVFKFNVVTDSGTTATTRDTIWGYFDGTAKGDKIDLSAIDANGNFATGNGAFHYIGAGGFSTGTIGEVQVKHVSGDQYLVSLDTDKDNSAEATILVHSGHALSAADFIL